MIKIKEESKIGHVAVSMSGRAQAIQRLVFSLDP